MQQSGKALLIFVVAILLLVGVAVLLHAPQTRPLLEHLHGAVHSAPTARTSGGSDEAMGRLREGIAALGPRWDAEAFAETVSLYTAVHRELEWPGLLEPETIRYGNDEQQTFDLFRPEHDFSEPGPALPQPC